MAIAKVTAFGVAASAGLLAPAALGQVVHESGGQPPARLLPRLTSRPFHFAEDGPHLQRQVNVNAQGLNVIGDAANEPSIAVDPTAPNRIVIGWRQFDSISSSFRQAGRAYSRDGGRTWINPGVLDPGVFRSDPVLRADAAGNFYYCSLRGPGAVATSIFKSSDGGATFSGPFPSWGGDKQWLAIDRTGLASDGTQYQHYTNAFTRSFDGGMTWRAPISGVPTWGTNAVGPNGELYIGGVGPIRVARSLNAHDPLATVTFTTVTVNLGGQHVSFNQNSPNPGGLAGQLTVDVDRSGGPRHGWIYVLGSVSGGDPMNVMFNRSSDGGQTWLITPTRVNDDPFAPGSWQWFGTMSVAPNGRIDVVWNDTRESQQARLSRLYYAWSDDGGDTWEGNEPLGPQWDSYVGWPNQQKIGDYYDMHSDRVGAFLAYAATYNGEQDVYFLRINDYDCNDNGIGDTEDLAAGVLHDCNGNGVPDECEAAAGVVVVCPCYANCDGSTEPPVLNVADFACFLQRFAASDPWANCDESTTAPVLNVADFGCFLQRFAAGCR